LLLLCPARVSAETPGEYRTALATVLSAAEAAQVKADKNASLIDNPTFARVLSSLEAIQQVTDATGNTVVVDNRALIERLKGSHDESTQAIEDVRQLLEAMDASTLKTNDLSPEQAHTALDQVLKQSEFNQSSSNGLDDLRQQLFRWIGERFPGFKAPDLLSGELGSLGEWLTLLLVVVVVLFALVLIGYLFYNTRISMTRQSALQNASAERREDARAARLGALKAADEGEFRLAIHYLYLWAILYLSEKSQLRYDRSLTNRELLRMLIDHQTIAALFKPAVESFDHLWYGQADCSDLEYRDFRATIERIVEAAP
jgi:hypothetical protein